MNVLILLCKVLNARDNCACCLISTFILSLGHQLLLNNLLLLRVLGTLRGLRCHYPISLVLIIHY